MPGASENEVDRVEIGAVLAGKYRVDKILGQGGMGFVVAATHLQMDEPVAMKFLHAAVAKQADLVARFQREAKAARKIRSEHVVRILDVGELENGAPYLIMEYLEGTDLDRLIRNEGPQSVTNTVDYVLQASEALAEAHVQGMVHRDLKPANLFVARRADKTALIKVLDFGISKVTGADGADLGVTKTNSAVLGSPLYMAPEQMRSLRGVDARTDIWSLGVILHEMLAGVTPFHATTLPELCAAILQDPPPSIRERRSDVPEGLAAVLERCMEKEPAKRFADVAALAAALAPFASTAGKASAERIAGVFRAYQPAPVVIDSSPPAPMISAMAQTEALPPSVVDPNGPTRPLEDVARAKSDAPPRASEPPVGAATTGKAWAHEERGPYPDPPARTASEAPPRAPRRKRGFPIVFAAAVTLGAVALVAAYLNRVPPPAEPNVPTLGSASPPASVSVNAIAPPPPAVPAPPSASATSATVLIPIAEADASTTTSKAVPMGLVVPVPVVPMPSVNVPLPNVPVVPAKPPDPSCVNPHYYDDAGVQRWKKECLRP